MKIGVIFGGVSSEREVSVLTGLSVVEALGKVHEIKSIHYNGMPQSLLDELYDVDIVFNALHGGDGENGNIQSFLELHNISFVGSGSEASKIAMDKDITKSLAKANSIPTPDWISIVSDTFNDSTKLLHKDGDKIDYPLVVKPANEGSTFGISIVKDDGQLDKSIEHASKFSNKILIEKYIAGRELSVSILGNKSLPIVEIIIDNSFYDYDAKYNSIKTKYVVPAALDFDTFETISNDAIKIYNLIGCDNYARVDFRLDLNGSHKLLEVNTLPGLTPTSIFPKAANAAGLNYEQLLNTLVDLGEYKYVKNL